MDDLEKIDNRFLGMKHLSSSRKIYNRRIDTNRFRNITK